MVHTQCVQNSELQASNADKHSCLLHGTSVLQSTRGLLSSVSQGKEDLQMGIYGYRTTGTHHTLTN